MTTDPGRPPRPEPQEKALELLRRVGEYPVEGWANDAIVVVNNLVAERDQLREALRKLANEADSWSWDALREVGGVTNANCLKLRIEEARSLLAAADAPGEGR